MRHAYLDEAGLGNEPYAVVAGILIHADDQYSNLQKYILDMTDDLVGRNRPIDFVYSAKEIWNGGKFFNRQEWPRKRRFEILRYLSDIPKIYNLPVIYTCIDKKRFPPKSGIKKDKVEAIKKIHTLCFMSCIHHIDKYVTESFPGESFFVISEDHESHRLILREAANFMTHPWVAEILKHDKSTSWGPAEKLTDEPLFQKKSGKSPLQVADVCAFILNRHLSGDDKISPFLEAIKPQLPWGLRTEFVVPKVSVISEAAIVHEGRA